MAILLFCFSTLTKSKLVVRLWPMRLGGNVLEAFGKCLSSLIREKVAEGGPFGPAHFLLRGMLKYETGILKAAATCLDLERRHCKQTGDPAQKYWKS